jgi:hypothetical protein
MTPPFPFLTGLLSGLELRLPTLTPLSCSNADTPEPA